ncbi:MAG: ATP-binding cassette domain-containing protein [Pseudonocardiaceae bacterium]
MSRGSVTFSDMSFSWGDGTPVFGGFGGSLISGRTGLVGPNGAGKSTLLRLVVGELRSWNGTTNPRKLTSSQVAGSIMSPNGLLIPFRLLTPTKGTIRVVGELGYLPQTALLTFLWVPVHDQMRAHAVPCLVFPAYQSWKRS